MSGHSLRWDAARVDLSDAGVVTAVVHDADPGRSYLATAGELRVLQDGTPVTWSAPELGVDADEVEVTRAAGPLRLVVRHSVAVGWGVRLVLSNSGDQPVTLDDAVLTWQPPADQPAWALAAGAAGSYAVLPLDGRGPVLGGVLRLGELAAVDGDGLHLGRLLLEAQGRYVVQWHWDFHADARSFDRGRHPDVPRRLDLLVGEVVTVAADEDQALVAAGGLEVETVRDTVELSGAEAGELLVELRSARGLTRFELAVAEPLEAVLQARATDVLAGPRTAAGVVRLADVDAALVVQRALASAVLSEPDLAEEALDLFTARLPEDERPDPRTVGYLCGEHSRTGDAELLARAGEAVLGAAEPAPGLGMAATELCLARLLLGQPLAPVLDHLARLAGEAELPPGASPLSAQAALLELEVVTMSRAGLTEGRRGPAAAVTARVAALGGWVGAGLKGRAVRPVPVDALAHLASVVTLLPEDLSAGLRPRWGCSAHELARRGQATVLARLGTGRPGPALSWLVLGARPG